MLSKVSRRWKQYGLRMFSNAMQHNVRHIQSILADAAPSSADGTVRVLDLGCGSGDLLLRYAPSRADLHGVEQDRDSATIAAERGVTVLIQSLESAIQLPESSFDVVVSNQVIEHLFDTDQFMAECHRLVRPGGIVVISTENLASWHNIGALFLGWQAFSLTNVSGTMSSIGNPLGNLRSDAPQVSGMQHRRIFSYRGLLELMSAHGFSDIQVRGAGYYPFPTSAGQIDPRHAAFLTVAGLKSTMTVPL